MKRTAAKTKLIEEARNPKIANILIRVFAHSHSPLENLICAIAYMTDVSSTMSLRKPTNVQ